jgi:glycosyltransferase involved in cell wall biosynthesis
MSPVMRRSQTGPLVSIVTPSFNQGCFLEGTIASVSQQTYPHIEHIVVDAGSTDGTVAVLSAHSNRIRWVSEPDSGQSDGLNKGWKMATGQILGWLNADDEYLPDAVEQAVQELVSRDDVGMVFGSCTLMDEKGDDLRDWTVRNFDQERILYHPDWISTPSAFFRKDLLERVGFLDTSLHCVMDYDFWIRLARSTRIRYIPRPLARFRVHPRSKTRSRSQFRMFWREVFEVYRRHGGTGFSRLHVYYIRALQWYILPPVVKRALRRILMR